MPRLPRCAVWFGSFELARRLLNSSRKEGAWIGLFGVLFGFYVNMVAAVGLRKGVSCLPGKVKGGKCFCPVCFLPG